tara:strand:- start:247 stop:537 length:291 start_codon:yes stop_codon:yes gene_type:complete
MTLPKINYEDLPEEVKDVVDEDFVFDPVLDREYVVKLPISGEEYVTARLMSARKSILQKQFVEEATRIYKKLESGKISEDKAKQLLKEAMDKRDGG